MDNQKTVKEIDRRSFLHSAAVAGAGLALSPMVMGQTDNSKKPDDINVALLGAGTQGYAALAGRRRYARFSGGAGHYRR